MKKIFEYIKESYNELVYKVSWPTRAEFVVIFVIDMSFEGVMRFFYEKIF